MERTISQKVEIEEISTTNIIDTMCGDQNGNLCIYDLNGDIYILDSTGEFLFQKKLNGQILGNGISVDGNILIMVYELGECAVYEIEVGKKKAEKKRGK